MELFEDQEGILGKCLEQVTKGRPRVRENDGLENWTAPNQFTAHGPINGPIRPPYSHEAESREGTRSVLVLVVYLGRQHDSLQVSSRSLTLDPHYLYSGAGQYNHELAIHRRGQK